MEGNNEIRLCLAETMKAIEYYFNNKLFKEPIKVTGVDKVSGYATDGFVIKVSEYPIKSEES